MSIECKKCKENYCTVCDSVCPKCKEVDVADDKTMKLRKKLQEYNKKYLARKTNGDGIENLKISPKIKNLKDFGVALNIVFQKSGISEPVKEMPYQPTNKFRVTFKNENKNRNKN